MILLAVVVFIAVPTALALRFWRLSDRQRGELEGLSQQYREAESALALLEEESQALQARAPEAISYQELYPDFYVTEPMPQVTSEPGTMYLTFDDGPSDNTEEILAVLREKGVKATFFVVTKGGDKAVERMKKIVAEGHTLAMHSYTHDFATVYASVEACLEDYYQLFTLIRDEVGVTPTVFRFPGGSINGHNQGIYEEIAAEMLRRGFVYFDWNLSAQDALSVAPPKETILHCILGSSGRKNRGVVLMHDINHCDTTVEALPELIDGLREQGFTFDRLDRSVKPVIFNYRNY